MTRKVSFSNDNRDIDDIMFLFNTQEKGIYSYKSDIINSLDTKDNFESQFVGYTRADIDDHFKDANQELENTTCLSLLSAVEARLRVDYLKRVYDKEKDKLSRRFRNTYKSKGNKASLEEDILRNWTKYHPQIKNEVGNYKGALKYRNWLAHGRYWTLKIGREYDINTIYDICNDIIKSFDE